MCHNPLHRVKCTIISNHKIQEGIYNMVIEHKGMAQKAVPGQFVNLYVNAKDKLLPRPISLCQIDKEAGTLRLVYATLGEGTKLFSTYEAGEELEVLGPLGTGFTLEEKAKVLLVGGGVGTPPLLELAKNLKRQWPDTKITTILGFRDTGYLVEEFQAFGEVFLATDSGKQGIKGTVIDILKERNIGNTGIDYVYSCGPTPMLRALQHYMEEQEMSGEFSLEERMGCGFGACVGCVVPIRDGEDFQYKKVCKDGPVFPYKEVIFS